MTYGMKEMRYFNEEKFYALCCTTGWFNSGTSPVAGTFVRSAHKRGHIDTDNLLELADKIVSFESMRPEFVTKVAGKLLGCLNTKFELIDDDLD